MFNKTDLILLLNHLKEVKDKKYTLDCDKNSAYVFNTYSEFKSYFKDNGVKISNDLLDLCTYKILDNGKIIALKALCDHVIKNARLCKVLTQTQIDYIHLRNKITFAEKVEEWEEYNICAPGVNEKGKSDRCKHFNSCYACLTEYAAAKDEYDETYTDTFKKKYKMIK